MPRLALGASLAGLIAVAGGCSAATTTTGTTVTGSTLSIYTHQNPGAAAQDVVEAEKLALQQAGGQVGHYRVSLHVLSSGSDTTDARTAIQDASTIAYLGELLPQQSADTIGITNALGVLQVSPTDTALELTESTVAVPGSPNIYYESLSTYGRTFGRVVPATDREAVALVAAMGRRARRLYVASDGSAYGRAAAAAVGIAARRAGITVVTGERGRTPGARIKAAGAQAVFDGVEATNAAAAATLFDAAVAAVPGIRCYAPSSLDDDAFAASLGRAGPATTVTAPGFLPTGPQPPARSKFSSDFSAAYGHSPSAQAIFGYTAMAVVLDSLRRAGNSAGTRSEVIRQFLRTTNLATPIGPVSIDSATGNLKGIAPYVLNRVRGGRLVAYASEQGL